MSTHKRIDIICVVVMICALILTILFMNGEKLGLKLLVDEDTNKPANDYFTANDLDGDWDTSSATRITLDGENAKVSGRGAYVLDGDVVIAETGWYVVEGSLSDGSIIVDAHKTSKVWIQMNGAKVYCSDSAAFIVEKADKVFLTLAEGTDNILKSGEVFSDSSKADGILSAIYTREDFTINGSGSLTISTGYGHGIIAKDDLTITGGTIQVYAQKDAIRTSDSFCFCEGTLSVDTADDGIVQKNQDCVFYIASGTVNVRCNGDAFNAVSRVVIGNGSCTITAGDDGIHSDDSIIINGGDVLLKECYEGLEAPIVVLTGGNTEIYPSDDGINANGESGRFGEDGGDGEGDADTEEELEDEEAEPVKAADNADIANEAAEDAVDDENAAEDAAETVTGPSEEPAAKSYLAVTGGSLTIVNKTGKDCDGIDSKGDIYITGGDVRISLANIGTNCAMDYDKDGGVCMITGGTVVAAGNYMMAEHFDSSSTQASILYTYKAGAQSGTTAAITDTDGNVLLSWEVPCSYSAVSLSCPEMTVGGTYDVVIGNNVEEITIKEISAAYGDGKSAEFLGTMNFGEMQPLKNLNADLETAEGEEADIAAADADAAAGTEQTGDGAASAEDGQPGGSEGGQPGNSVEGEQGESEGEQPGNSVEGEQGESEGEQPGNSVEGEQGESEGEQPGNSVEGEQEADSEGEQAADSEGAERPDIENGAELPQMGESEGLEQPEFDGEMPAFDGEIPEFNGELPEFAEGDSFGESWGLPPIRNDTNDAEEETTVASRTALSELSSDVWKWLGISVAVIVAGLLVVFFYRRGRL